MPRTITIDEIRAVASAQDNVSRLLDPSRFAANYGNLWHETRAYEHAIDTLIALARPDLIEIPTPPLSPEASGAAAAGVASSPPAGSGHPSPSVTAGLLTYEGLHDALIAFHAELREGTFQPDPGTDAATQQFNYIIRHAERQSDEAEFAAAAAVMGVAA